MNSPLIEPNQELWGWMLFLMSLVIFLISLFIDNKYFHMVV